MQQASLPEIMVAPNGARRGRKDHPALPVTDDELIDVARSSISAGAGGIHVHIRDANGKHLLDASRYRELVDRLQDAVPDTYVQVTSEAAGIYSAESQMQMMYDLQPKNVSVAMREMVRTPEDWPKAERFYWWAAETGVSIQHIVYSPQELSEFLSACDRNEIPGKRHLLQFVLGDYAGAKTSRPKDIAAFTDLLKQADGSLTFDWMLCAFGQQETHCLLEALRQGGKARVGFENSLWNADGHIAASNAERVAELVRLKGN